MQPSQRELADVERSLKMTQLVVKVGGLWWSGVRSHEPPKREAPRTESALRIALV